MSAAPIFCKFSHNATLHAEGNSIRVYWNSDQGYSTGPGSADLVLDARDGPIIGAVFVSEFVAHVMTCGYVYEINGEHGFEARRLAPTMRVFSRSASIERAAQNEIARLEAKVAELEDWKAHVSNGSELLRRVHKAEAELAAMKDAAA